MRQQLTHAIAQYQEQARGGGEQRGIRRQTNCGRSRITADAGPNAHGIQTVRRPLARARAVAAATCDGVLDSGAGVIPSVIRPMTKPGRTISSRTPVPCSASANPLANPSRPAFAEPYT